ncbi:Periplasmic binding protein/LacI transcriptional regulator, partial [Pseudomonas syringae pv. coryli]
MRGDARHRFCAVRPNNNHKIGDELMKLPFAGRLLAVAMFAAVTAVMPLSTVYAQTPEKPKVALVMKSLANEFFLTMEDGAKAYQKEHATEFDLISNGIKDESDTSAQIRIVEQ